VVPEIWIIAMKIFKSVFPVNKKVWTIERMTGLCKGKNIF
jgi:hypothetical protein